MACNEIPLIIIFSQATTAFNSNILYLFLQFLNLSCSILENIPRLFRSSLERHPQNYLLLGHIDEGGCVFSLFGVLLFWGREGC